jgi:Domain of unknown function (DUF4062)
MDKRFQVFVSSTFDDLRDERRQVINTLMGMDCIPAGMELFPASDEEQLQFIKRIIDDCDYYIVIVGGRYGTLTSNGLSYTEREYDYAVERGIPVLAFLQNPSDIPPGTAGGDGSGVLLSAFREKLTRGRIAKVWSTASELAGVVAVSLGKTIRAYPAVGWVRANQVASSDVLTELNEVRKRNEELTRTVAELSAANAEPAIQDLAGLEDTVTVAGTRKRGEFQDSWKITLTWGELFALIAPQLLDHPNDGAVKYMLRDALVGHSGTSGAVHINEQDYQTVKVQLMAMKLVRVAYLATVKGGMGLFWSLTPDGSALMLRLRTAKKKMN